MMLNIDRHIAISAGWIGGPAFGVAMMAAPEYFHLGAVASGLLFWGGIIVFLLTIIVVVIISLHEKGKRPIVFGPILTMALGALIFCGGASWYFWPSNSPHKPWKHTLEDLYLSDFSDLLSIERKVETTISDQSRGLEPTKVEIRVRDYQDYRSNSDFLSIFIPMANDVRIADAIYGIIKGGRDQFRSIRDDLHNSVGIGSGSGTSYSESKNLIFSGRIFIYTSQPFNVIQLGELASWYRDGSMVLEIRGHDYWWANKDR